MLAAPEHQALAREAAAKAVVLLQNEPVDGTPLLPLDPDVHRVAVLGRLADVRNLGDGGSSDVYAPIGRHRRSTACGPRSPRSRSSTPTDPIPSPPPPATDADLAIVVVGYTRADEGEFIGDVGHQPPPPLLPGADDPEEAAAFEARLPRRSGPRRGDRSPAATPWASRRAATASASASTTPTRR